MYAVATPVTLGTAGSAQVRQRRAVRIRAQASAIRRASALLTAQVTSAAVIQVIHGTAQHVQATARQHFPSAAHHQEHLVTIRQVILHGRKRLTPPIIGAEPAHTATV